jgi:hypothetical protein
MRVSDRVIWRQLSAARIRRGLSRPVGDDGMDRIVAGGAGNGWGLAADGCPGSAALVLVARLLMAVFGVPIAAVT